MTARFYKVECVKDNETEYFKNIECKINPKGNGNYTISIYGDLKVEINYMLVNFVSVHINSRKVLVNLTGECCSHSGQLLPIVHIIIDLVKKYQKNLFQKCPYIPQDKFGFINFPGDQATNQLLNSFPNYFKLGRGEYTVTFNAKDRNGKIIFGFKTFVSVAQKKAMKI